MVGFVSWILNGAIRRVLDKIEKERIDLHGSDYVRLILKGQYFNENQGLGSWSMHVNFIEAMTREAEA